MLNVSLDKLRKDRFRAITQTDHFDRVMAGIDAALDAGFAPLKINVVAMRGREVSLSLRTNSASRASSAVR